MILFKNITMLDKDGGISEGRFVQVKGSRILSITDRRLDGVYEREYDGTGKLLMPAFYNTHAHSPMTLLRGYGENLTLSDWLNDRIFPFEEHLDDNAVYWATLLAIAESFRYGIVSSTDMYFFTNAMARAAVNSGAKMNLSRALVGFDEEKDMRTSSKFREASELFEEVNGVGDGRIRVEMALHAEYTSTQHLVAQLAAYAKEIGAQVHVHVSETQAEHEACKGRHGGLTPVRYFSDLGLFDSKTTAAHCVWVEDEDMDILAEKHVTVASCPVSNLKLASGVCNVPRLRQKGVAVSIGTDSVASNNSLNILSDIKFFALLNKERRADPTLITPKEAIEAATIVGAQAQGRTDCGRISEGWRADLIVLDITGPHMTPVHDLYNNLVYSASGSDVVLTMADGRIVYEDGTYPTIDLERVKSEVNSAKDKILGELNV
jgi:5-methylthioadenosine/S-adenosylhomocysteine deaminase